jgi:hypothetical protein
MKPASPQPDPAHEPTNPPSPERPASDRPRERDPSPGPLEIPDVLPGEPDQLPIPGDPGPPPGGPVRDPVPDPTRPIVT